jgi:hypothetical protein
MEQSVGTLCEQALDYAIVAITTHLLEGVGIFDTPSPPKTPKRAIEREKPCP